MPQDDGDPKVKLFQLSITREIEAESIEDARQKAAAFVGKIENKDIRDGVSRVTRGKYSSRASRLSAAASLIGEAITAVAELKDECQEWYDNLPENFQNGDKGSTLQEAVNALENIESNLDSAGSDCDSVEFPGMFG